ncbi:MAG TPA: ferredoxin [Candidatus Nanoarchaeia archaeon]|nr:ferredoxin [Candidatus Nanoarchaeia archaeon]
MTKKAYVDKDICIGCSVCTDTCPAVFTVKEDPNYAKDFKSFTDDEVDQEPLAGKVQEAIDSCPVQCISWREKKDDSAKDKEN